MSIENIVDYWQRFWVDRVDKLLKAEKYDDIAKSPRLLLYNMLLEIKYNGFKNDNNWNLFRQQLEKWRKNELVFKNLFNNEYGIILANWRHELCINQCNSIVAKMNSGVY